MLKTGLPLKDQSEIGGYPQKFNKKFVEEDDCSEANISASHTDRLALDGSLSSSSDENVGFGLACSDG